MLHDIRNAFTKTVQAIASSGGHTVSLNGARLTVLMAPSSLMDNFNAIIAKQAEMKTGPSPIMRSGLSGIGSICFGYVDLSADAAQIVRNILPPPESRSRNSGRSRQEEGEMDWQCRESFREILEFLIDEEVMQIRLVENQFTVGGPKKAVDHVVEQLTAANTDNSGANGIFSVMKQIGTDHEGAAIMDLTRQAEGIVRERLSLDPDESFNKQRSKAQESGWKESSDPDDWKPEGYGDSWMPDGP